MKVLAASIFALLALANAERPHAGLAMVDYVMKEIAQPSATMTKLIREAFPEVEAGAKKDAVQKLDNCLTDVNSRSVTVCAKLHAFVSECLVPVKEYYEKDLPESAKDIPKMVYESNTAVIQHICNSKTEDFLELSNQCLFKPGTQEQKDKVVRTYEEKAKIFKSAPTKTNLCEIVNGLRPLIEESIKFSCKSDVTVKAFMACYDASAKPCTV